MGRTLYLNGTNNHLVVTRDGPSVWVKSKERAGQRVPVRLLGRVIVIGNVRLDASAITLLAEHDVPVVFMTHGAEEVAMAIPYNHKLPTHYEEQKVLLECDEHIRRYEEWAQAKRTIIQTDMMKRLRRLAPARVRYGIGEGDYQSLLSDLKPKAEERWALVMGIITNLIRGVIMEQLLKADLDPHLGVLHRRHNFGLVLDLCHIMGAESDMQTLQFFRSAQPALHLTKGKDCWRITDKGMHDIIHRFENRRRTVHNMVENIIDELFELMRELRL
ncbi:MAG: CRISPR-associated endonuclease Cas1 [Nitrospirota bacterium]